MVSAASARLTGVCCRPMPLRHAGARMRVTVRLSDALAAHVDAVRQDSETSDAEAVRECIRRSQSLGELEARVADLETDVERLRSEKRTLIRDREERGELVAYVEAEEQRRRAGLLTRSKWWLFGRDE
jgi:septal ring factor EnvC (AmiA/AmiB activator)